MPRKPSKSSSRKPSAASKSRKKPSPQETTKSSDYSGFWTPIGGSPWGGRDGDGPSPSELIACFADTVYACASLIATSLSAIDIRLVAETKTGQELPRQPAHPVRSAATFRHKVGLRTKAMELHEISDNPVLDLLYSPNPDASYTDLLTATSVYLEVLGRAFWLVTDHLGLPGRIDLLPAHLVRTIRDDSGRAVRYEVGSGQDVVTYPAEPNPNNPGSRSVVAFRRHHQMDPEGEGISPLKAVWQQVRLSNSEIASWESIVGQLAQPMLMLSPAPGEMMGPENAQRMAKEMTARFYQSGKGGIFVNPDHLQVQPISWPPKDMAGLQLQQHLKDRICNAYHMPRTLLDTQDASYASSKATERTFQLFCLKPRITYLLERVSHALVSRYDPRLFLVPGEFVQQDEAVIVQMRQTAVTGYQAQILTKNEARFAFDADPLPEGNTFAPAPDLNTATMGLPGNKAKGVNNKYDLYPLRPLVEVFQRWFAKQSERYGTKAASDEDQGLADELYPVIKAYWQEAASRLATRIDLTGSPWDIVQNGIDRAAKQAALKLAESTNRTTNLEIEEARRILRESLAAGLVQGEEVNLLADRVQRVFERASTQRAYLIADSERTRAINGAEQATAKAAGLSTKTWLADNLACPICSDFNGREVPIDEPFGVDRRGGPYAVKQAPPAHPGCRCVTVWG